MSGKINNAPGVERLYDLFLAKPFTDIAVRLKALVEA
jgi:hypothetical protein